MLVTVLVDVVVIEGVTTAKDVVYVTPEALDTEARVETGLPIVLVKTTTDVAVGPAATIIVIVP